MSLIEKIKNDSVTARKNKDPNSSFLVTLYAEAAKIGKDNGNRETTDEEVLRVIKKFKDNANVMLEIGNQRNDQGIIDCATNEISILESYQPKQLTEAELRVLIENYVNTAPQRTMGAVMAKLKENHTGMYDGALASRIVKEMI